MIEVHIFSHNSGVVKETIVGHHSYIELTDEVVQWLVEHVMEWDYVEMCDGFNFCFEYSDEAMIFKLVWG